MLTPSVRAAAAQFATSQLGAPHVKALEGAYLTGYARGYQARVKVASFPLTGQRELLRTLGPYLAEGIDVYHPASGQYGRLKGLPATYEGQGEPLADVEFYVGAESAADGCGDLTAPVGKVLPVLYAPEDFTQLSISPEPTLAGMPQVLAWATKARAAHCVVGLTSNEYHRRVVGFDYSQGARPACAACAGCDGKEVARA